MTRRVLLLLGLAVASALLQSPLGAQQIPVRVGGSPSSFVGVPFDLPIEVDMSARSEKLGSFALTLRWDPLVLQLLGGNDGNFGAMTVNDDSLEWGVIKFAGANPAGVGGKVVIGVGHFVPISSADDTIRLDVTELYAAGTFADLLPSATWSDRAYCPAAGRFGDIDGDQAANSRDALLALSYAVGTAVPGNPAMGDVDGDGATGARDALIILSNAVGLDVAAFRVMLVAPGACAAPRRPVLAVMPGAVTFDLGQDAQFTAVASDSTGSGIGVTDVYWKSSDDQVATVSPEGVVAAVGLGSATITAVRQSGVSASAAVTVVKRRTHWVDALANPDEGAQLGAPELPFRDIQRALDYARPGDTVRVRSGRYEEPFDIYRPVVLMGDTSGGKPRPVIAAFAWGDPGVTVEAPGRVELHALKLDTLTAGMGVWWADTLLVRWVEFRAPQGAYAASLGVEYAGAVYVQRSDFFGPGTGYYYYNNGIEVYQAGLVSIDSSYVAEYGYDGVALMDVDSLLVRGSTIRYNQGYGVLVGSEECGECAPGRAAPAGAASVVPGTPTVAAVFSGNRMTQNLYGHVYLDYSRSARFDHNHLVGGGYDAIQIYGAIDTTVVTFRGDTIDSRSGKWLYLSQFDSLAVDSATILVHEGYPSLQGGRVITAQDTRFQDVMSSALDIYPSPQDSTALVLRRVEFRGPDSTACDRCGTMVSGQNLAVDADSVMVVNASKGFDLYASRLALRHTAMQRYYTAAYLYCGSANVAGSSFAGDGAEYGIQLYGCGAADSLVVDSASFQGHSDVALYAGTSAAAMLVSHSMFTDNGAAISQSCGQLRVDHVMVTQGSEGVSASGCSSADTLRVDQSSFSQLGTGVSLTAGAGFVVATNSVFDANGTGVYINESSGLVSGNQFTVAGGTGVYSYWYSSPAHSLQVLQNTVDCGPEAGTAVSVYRYPYYYPADTVTIADNSTTGCHQGVSVQGGSRVTVRHNTVALPPAGTNGIYVDADSAALVVSNSVDGRAAEGSIRVEAVPLATVDSNVVTNAAGAGLRFPASIDTLRVRDNSVANLVADASVSPSGAILLNASAASNVLAQLQRNRIAGTSNGIVMLRGGADTVTVRLDSNTVRHADSIGVWVGNSTAAWLRFNAIDSSGVDGVRVMNNYRPVVLDSNNLTRNQHFGVNNLDDYQIDAADNWWGDLDNSGPACAATCGSGDSVSILVTFTPWLPGSSSTYAPAPRMIAAERMEVRPVVRAAPARQAVRRVWEAPAPVPSRSPATRSPAPARVVPEPPALERSGRWAQRLAAAAQAEAARLRQREAEQARVSEQQEAQRQARDQRRAAQEQARAAQRREAPPPRRPQ
jgi:hypothetical protein